MKKFFKKEYIFIIFVFAFVLSTILLNPLGDLDEIWMRFGIIMWLEILLKG